MKEFKSYIGELKPIYKANQNIHKAHITNSKQAAAFFRSIWPDDLNRRETAIALYLNRANNTMGYSIICVGSTSAAIVDPKLVFGDALICCANSIMLAHNHPSGNLKPSNEDHKLTQKIKAGGNLLDILVIDHIILTEDSYYSFADDGNM